jgi:hypothetical protein
LDRITQILQVEVKLNLLLYVASNHRVFVN